MSYEEHQKNILRRHNEEIAKQNERDGGDSISFILGTFWYALVYSPFLIIAMLSGNFVHKQFSFEPIPSGIVGLVAGYAIFFLINLIEAFSDDLKKRGNRLYILIKIFVLIFVAGIPFLIGFQLGIELIKDTGISFQKIMTGVFLGLVFAIPAYYQVILNGKDDSGY